MRTRSRSCDGALDSCRQPASARYAGAEIGHEIQKDDGRFEVDLERSRRDTAGTDVLRLKVKRLGGPEAVTRTIRLR